MKKQIFAWFCNLLLLLYLLARLKNVDDIVIQKCLREFIQMTIQCIWYRFSIDCYISNRLISTTSDDETQKCYWDFSSIRFCYIYFILWNIMFSPFIVNERMCNIFKWSNEYSTILIFTQSLVLSVEKFTLYSCSIIQCCFVNIWTGWKRIEKNDAMYIHCLNVCVAHLNNRCYASQIPWQSKKSKLLWPYCCGLSFRFNGFSYHAIIFLCDTNHSRQSSFSQLSPVNIFISAYYWFICF